MSKKRKQRCSDPNEFDAIVIGSGIGGGVAARELTEKGLKTILLERGMNIAYGAPGIVNSDQAASLG